MCSCRVECDSELGANESTECDSIGERTNVCHTPGNILWLLIVISHSKWLVLLQSHTLNEGVVSRGISVLNKGMAHINIG